MGWGGTSRKAEEGRENSLPSWVRGLSRSHGAGDLLWFFFPPGKRTCRNHPLQSLMTGTNSGRLQCSGELGLLPLNHIATWKEQEEGKTKPAWETRGWICIPWLAKEKGTLCSYLFLSGTKMVTRHGPLWTLGPSVGCREQSGCHLNKESDKTCSCPVPTVTLDTVSLA